MDYADSYMLIEHEQKQKEQQSMILLNSLSSSAKVEIQKKICKKKYQKALKWAHLPSPYSENQTPENFLLYGNVKFLTNYNEETIRYQYTSECIVENGYYKVDKVSMSEKLGMSVEVSQIKVCLDKFQFLINLFKRYESSKYIDLVNTLLQYQKYIKQENERSNLMYKQLKKESSLSNRFQEEYHNFEQKTISHIHAQTLLSNKNHSFYSYQTLSMNYKSGQPEIKKLGTSQPLILLLGNSVQNEYQSVLLKMRRQSSFTKNQENNLLKTQQSISKAIFMINNIINEEKSFSYTETLMTRDGFEIACTIKAEMIRNTSLNYIKFYEARDQQVILFTYTFNESDIQTLLSKREELPQLSTSTFSSKKEGIVVADNLMFENLEEFQSSSNFNIDHTSETLNQNSILDFNNHCNQLQTNQQTLPHHCQNQESQSAKQLRATQIFSPLSVASSTMPYSCKGQQRMSSDYTRQSQFFINKYYKPLPYNITKLPSNSKKQHPY